MVKTSMDYRRAVVQDRIFHVRAVMRFLDGTEMVLTNTELMTDGLTIKQGYPVQTALTLVLYLSVNARCAWIIRMAGLIPMISRVQS